MGNYGCVNIVKIRKKLQRHLKRQSCDKIIFCGMLLVPKHGCIDNLDLTDKPCCEVGWGPTLLCLHG